MEARRSIARATGAALSRDTARRTEDRPSPFAVSDTANVSWNILGFENIRRKRWNADPVGPRVAYRETFPAPALFGLAAKDG
jgi:hypothetical protein